MNREQPADDGNVMTTKPVIRPCINCRTEEINIRFEECGHTALCVGCASYRQHCIQCDQKVLQCTIETSHGLLQLSHRALMENRIRLDRDDYERTVQIALVGEVSVNIHDQVLLPIIQENEIPALPSGPSLPIQRQFRAIARSDRTLLRASAVLYESNGTEEDLIERVERLKAEVVVICLSPRNEMLLEKFRELTRVLRKDENTKIVWLLCPDYSGATKVHEMRHELEKWLMTTNKGQAILHSNYFSLVGGISSISSEHLGKHLVRLSAKHSRFLSLKRAEVLTLYRD